MRVFAFVLAAIAVALPQSNAPSRSQNAEFSLIGAHLAGAWNKKDDVSAMLGDAVRGPIGTSFTFKEDASVKTKFTESIIKQGVFLAGIMTKSDGDFPFVLTQFAGNPIISWLREHKLDPGEVGISAEFKSLYVSIAVGATKDKDLLFIGDPRDLERHGFIALGRESLK